MAIVQGGKVLDDQSLAANFTSDTINIAGCDGVAVEIASASNTHVGALNIQMSITGDNWGNIQLNDATLSNAQVIPLASGSALTKVYAMDFNRSMKYLRFNYTATSGAGTLNAYVRRGGSG